VGQQIRSQCCFASAVTANNRENPGKRNMPFTLAGKEFKHITLSLVFGFSLA
jgi:hypothetical protein